MTKENCPIVIFYEEVRETHVSQVVFNLVPTLKNLGFENFAIEQAGIYNQKALLNHYKLLSILHLVNEPEPNKNTIETYRLLNNIDKHNLSINSIDLKDFNYYTQLQNSYFSFRNRFYKVISNSLKELEKNGSSFKLTLLPNSNKVLIEANNKDLLATSDKCNNCLQESEKVENQIQSTEIFYSSFFSLPGIKSNFGLMTEHVFIKSRTKNFASEIENLCKQKNSGIFAILGAYHYQVSNILQTKGYEVKSFYIGTHDQLDSLATFKKYSPKMFDQSIENIEFFDVASYQITEIVGQIEQELIEHFS